VPLLVLLGPLQVAVRRGEIGAGVLPVPVQEQIVEPAKRS
jgi:hypothetical protein